MCLQRGESGGYPGIVSTLTIHNEILATRPDLLEPLYEGYYYAIAEARFSANPVTDFKIPVFCCIDDIVSAGYSRSFITDAARLRGEPVPAKLTEALDYFDATAERDDLRAKFLLEPGEMLLWHNFQMLHARDAYQDSPEHARHLLRLWLRIENDRPIADAILQRAAIYERLYRERKGQYWLNLSDQAALLVFLATAAWARIVAADFDALFRRWPGFFQFSKQRKTGRRCGSRFP